MSALVIFASESQTEAAAPLAAMGHAIRSAHDVTRAQIRAARKVIVVWSRAARGTPALSAMARAAGDKLMWVRLDETRPPVDLGGKRALRLPPGRALGPAWRRLLRGAARPRAVVVRAPGHSIPPAMPRTTQSMRVLSRLAALALVALAAGVDLYARDLLFAARIDALAHSAQTQAATLLDEVAP